MRSVIFTVLFFMGFVFSAVAQQKGSIDIHADNSINDLMDKYSQIVTQNPCINGFRIQIFFDSGNTSKQSAVNMKNSFEARFPDIKAYLSFEEPNYKVRVGNFRNRLDAEGCLRKIVAPYPNAFIVPEYIEFPELTYPSVNTTQ